MLPHDETQALHARQQHPINYAELISLWYIGGTDDANFHHLGS